MNNPTDRWNDREELKDRLFNLNYSYYSHARIEDRLEQQVMQNHIRKEMSVTSISMTRKKWHDEIKDIIEKPMSLTKGDRRRRKELKPLDLVQVYIWGKHETAVIEKIYPNTIYIKLGGGMKEVIKPRQVRRILKRHKPDYSK